MFRRLHSLDDDACPVFEQGDLEKSVRLRVEDISRDADGITWLHCCCLFSKGQLPPHIAGALPSRFDAQHELVESIDAVQVPAAEVIGVSRVISTSTWRSLSPSDCAITRKRLSKKTTMSRSRKPRMRRSERAMVQLRQWGLGGVVERRGVVHLCDRAVRAACARPFLVCFARRGAPGHQGGVFGVF